MSFGVRRDDSPVSTRAAHKKQQVKNGSFGDFDREHVSKVPKPLGPSTAEPLSISKWANTNSPWSRSRSIWDREPVVKPQSDLQSKAPATGTLTILPAGNFVDRDAGNDGLRTSQNAESSRPAGPSRAPSFKTPGWNALSSHDHDAATDWARPDRSKMTPLHCDTRNLDPGPLPLELIKTAPPYCGGDPHRLQDPSPHVATRNDWAFKRNGNLDQHSFEHPNQRFPAVMSRQDDFGVAEQRYRPTYDFAPQLADGGYQSLSQSQYAPASAIGLGTINHDFRSSSAVQLTASDRSNSLPVSDSNASSLTSGFDSLSLNQVSSRSSASRGSQDDDCTAKQIFTPADRALSHSLASSAYFSSQQPRSFLPSSRSLAPTEAAVPEWRRGHWPSNQLMTTDSSSRPPVQVNERFVPDDWQSRNDQWLGEGSKDQRLGVMQDHAYRMTADLRETSLPHARQFLGSQFDLRSPNESFSTDFQHIVPTYDLRRGTSGSMYQPQPTMVELDMATGVRSRLLNEYKLDVAKGDRGGRRWELRDVYDHIVEFCGDQAGSKFIQVKLETAKSEERERVFREILPNACQLTCDVFGNYVMQRFFVHGDQTQKKVLAKQMEGKVMSLAKQMYGCRVLQKALKHVLVDQQSALAYELRPQVTPQGRVDKVLELIKDQNGNHVVQKIIKRVSWEHIPFVIDTCVQNLQQLAVHSYGCRVIQRLLTHYDGPLMPMILQELHSCAQTLITDQFGNYVTQHMIQFGAPEDRARMTETVRNNLLSFAKQKFASNVVEKCIIYGSEEQRRGIMLQLCRHDQNGGSPLTFMIKDNYGNYVIQKLLDVLDDADYGHFVAMLEPEIARIKRSLPSKQAENVYKKMHRFRSYQLNEQQMAMHNMRMSHGAHMVQV